jgi:Uncharacterized conserved protein (DUF2190)
MAGPNMVLDKGFKIAAAATNVEFGRFCKWNAGTTGDTVTTSAAPANPAVAADFIVGVYQETLDATKVATGKATLNVRMLGIARMRSGGAVPIGTPVTSDATGRAVSALAGTNLRWYSGIAMTAATGQDQFIDVLLTPGALSNSGVT